MSTASIRELRDRTGAGILDCKKALEHSNGDISEAINFLKIKGILKAEDTAKRTTAEGIVYAYIHHNERVGVLLELNCETDFVAMTPAFKEIAHSLSLHIVASKPLYVSRDSIPLLHEVQERELNRRKTLEEGKPEKVVDKIVDGRMAKFYKSVCLLEQEFILDETVTVEDYIKSQIVKFGENIKVKQFSLFTVGEEKDKLFN